MMPRPKPIPAAQGIDMTMDAPGSMNPLEKAIADA